MNERPTLLIVSYHFAPSPLVGAKRFSFLTREFTRMGFDVHVITNDIGESPHGTRRQLAAGHRHGASRRRAVRSAAQGRRILAPHRQRAAAPAARARGLDYFWARAATRKALAVARQTTARHRHRHLAAARGADRGRARRAATEVAADPRLPRSVERLRLAGNGTAAGSRSGLRAASRAPSCGEARRACSTRPACATGSRKVFRTRRAARNFVIPNGFDAVPAAAPLRGRADRNRARRRDLRQPLAGAAVARRRAPERSAIRSARST